VRSQYALFTRRPPIFKDNALFLCGSGDTNAVSGALKSISGAKKIGLSDEGKMGAIRAKPPRKQGREA